VPRILEREAVDHLVAAAHQRKRVEDANRTRMAVQQLPEVRLAQPAVNSRACLDTDDLRDGGRAADARGEVDLAEAAFAEQALDLVAEPCFRALDDFADCQQAARFIVRQLTRPHGAGRRRC